MASSISQIGPTSLETASILSPKPYAGPGKPKTLLELRELLGIQDSENGISLHCHGLNKRGTSCGSSLGKELRDQISLITRSLVNNWHNSTSTLKSLETLSSLVLCRRFHQSQAPSKYNEWILKLPSSPSISKISDKPKRELRCGRSTSDGSEQSPPTLDKATSAADTACVTQPVRLPNTNIPSKVRLGTRVSPRIQSNTSGASPSQAPETSVPTFIPFHKHLPSRQTAARKVVAKMNEPLLKTEKESGWVYIFRRANCSMLKIGTTTLEPEQRLKTIGTKCKYSPQLLFQFATPNAMKVERLVHLHLYKERRKESLINGCCNDGKGCLSQHKEWFEVAVEYAQAVVQNWAEWMKDQEPYDENGLLRDEWMLKSKIADLGTNEDIWMSWTKPTNPKGKKETEEVKIKTESATEKIHLVPIHKPGSRRIDDQADAEAKFKTEPPQRRRGAREVLAISLATYVKDERPDFGNTTKLRATVEIYAPQGTALKIISKVW